MTKTAAATAVDATFDDGSARLSDATIGDSYSVAKVTDERDEFLAYLYEVGVVPGARIDVLERTPFGDVLTIQVHGREKPVAVGKEVSTSVWVHPDSAQAIVTTRN